MIKRRNRNNFLKIAETLLVVSAGWGHVVYVSDWQQLLGNKKQSKQTWAVASMSQADRVFGSGIEGEGPKQLLCSQRRPQADKKEKNIHLISVSIRPEYLLSLATKDCV